MDAIFELLRQSRRSSQLANDLEGRSPFSVLGIVTNNVDPENKRRIRVTLQAKGGQTETDWLWRILASPSDDPPVPKVGQTVEICFIDGDPHQGCYKGTLTNAPNPEQTTPDPLLDDARVIEGIRKETVQKDDQQRIDQNQTVSVGKKLRLQNDAGAFLELTETGAIVLQDKWGNKLVLGGQSGGLNQPSDFIWNTITGNCKWNLGGNALEIQNASDVTIAGKSVIVVGSKDSDNDTNNQRGY